MKISRTSQRKHLEKAIDELGRKQARTGFFEHSKYPDGTSVAYVATIQEFGYPEGNIPPRPFFRPVVEGQKAAWRESLAKGSRAVLEGRMTVEHMLEQFGAQVAGAISAQIAAVQTPELSDATITARQAKRKTPGVSTKPLVDSGYMISQVNSDVVDK